MAPIPDPQTLKQVFDCIGYSVMGLAGLFGAWKRMRSSISNAPKPEKHSWRLPKSKHTQRIERLERDVSQLQERQLALHREDVGQHTAMLKQQAALFDLMVQQRAVIDRVLEKIEIGK